MRQQHQKEVAKLVQTQQVMIVMIGGDRGAESDLT
jgi:hypothetical protein